MRLSILKIKPSLSRGYLAILSVLLIACLLISGWLVYQNYFTNEIAKVYAIGEPMEFNDFTVTVKSFDVRELKPDYDTESIQKYGNIDSLEDCSAAPDEREVAKSKYGEHSSEYIFATIKYISCDERNASRQAIKDYLDDHRYLVVKYEIAAKSNVDTSQIDIKIVPGSGRDLKLQYMGNNKPFLRYYSSYNPESLGAELNSGLSRTREIGADIKNDEYIFDVVVTKHDGDTDISMISRIDLY